MAQGVKQVWPCPVRASAPGGSDSNRKACVCGPDGFDDSQSGIDGVIQSGIAEQPPSEMPMTAAAATTSPTRDMTLSVPKSQIVSPPVTPVKPVGAEKLSLGRGCGRRTLRCGSSIAAAVWP